MAVQYSIVYMYHNLFIYLSADGHLGCFHVPAIVNSAAVNNGTRVFFNFGFLRVYALLLTMPKPLTVWITRNCGKF